MTSKEDAKLQRLLNQSLQHHQAGRLGEAAAGYQEILQQNPRHSDALHLLGVVAQQMDKLDMAIELMKAAVAANPSVPHYHHNLGNTYLKNRQAMEAANCYRQAVLLKSDYFEAHFGMGNALAELNQPEIAAQAYGMALKLQPNFAEAHYNLGRMLSKLDQTDAAITCYRNAIQLDKNRSEYYFNLGNACQKKQDYRGAIDAFRCCLAIHAEDAECLFCLGSSLAADKRMGEAEEAYRRALALKPNYPECHNYLGELLAEEEKYEEATDCYERAIADKPGYSLAHFNLGLARLKFKDLSAAEASFRVAVDLDPDFVEAHYNLGNILRENFRQSDAIACYKRVLELTEKFSTASEPDRSTLKTARFRALCNLALALNELGEVDKAIEIYRESLKLEPEDARTHCNLAYALLADGRLPEGFLEQEWRWKLPVNRPRSFDRPLWKGEPLDGRTILIHSEQGLGDTIQFVRYLPLVAARGGRIVLDVQRSLARLFQSLPGVDQVIPTGDPLPEFSCHCPLMSLPQIFGTTMETISSVSSSLSVSSVAVEEAKEKWQGVGLRVGLAWSGNPGNPTDIYRSARLKHFVPLGTIPGVSFYSLQVGESVKEIAEVSPDFQVIDVCSKYTDFCDTAAFIAGLDLVITVDTAVAHLAGALGIPVWIMIANCRSDWRWFRDREDSPWYPSARIFRQPQSGDWPGLIEHVKLELAKVAAEHCRQEDLKAVCADR